MWKDMRSLFKVLCLVAFLLLNPCFIFAEGTVSFGLYFFPNGVIGQGSLAQDAPNRVDGKGLFAPTGIAIDTNVYPNCLYISDTGNNRILIWSDISDAFLGKAADLVLGQPNMWSNKPNYNGLTAESLHNPCGIYIGRNMTGELYVCDRDNHRVLIFKAPLSDDTKPDALLGQNSYNSGEPDAGSDISPLGFDSPVAVVVDASYNVYVSDSNNNRILMFANPLGSMGDALADTVIGQNSFTTNTCNQGGGIPIASSLCAPYGIAVYPDGRPWVSDNGNNRLLEYITPLNPIGGFASLVKAQPFFDTGFANWDGINDISNTFCYPTGLDHAEGICLDSAERLYVADSSNNRVLRWDYPTSAPAEANFVFGQQGNFYTGYPNMSGDPTEATLSHPTDVSIDSDGRIYIVDKDNNRVLRFSQPLTSFIADGVVGQPSFTISEPNYLDGSSLYVPVDVAIDFASLPAHLYVVDKNHNRVLGWNSILDALSGHPADVVGASPNQLDTPASIAVDGYSTLWMSTPFTNRIIGFQNPFLYDGQADYLIGQTSWSETSPNMGLSAPTAQSLSSPAGIYIDNSNSLWVADQMNHRVLRFPNPYMITPSADLVIGQPYMYSNLPNNPSIGPQSLAFPSDVTADGKGNLFVCDRGNNRVLFYFNPVEYAEADRVFGQMNSFLSGAPNVEGMISAGGLSSPGYIDYDPATDLLLVTDVTNNRVVGYYHATATADYDTQADIVFGQNGSMTSGGYNPNQEVSPTNLKYPAGIAVGPGAHFFVADSGYNRVLDFVLPSPPQIRSAVYVDLNNDDTINAGDLLILEFRESLKTVGSVMFSAEDFQLTLGLDSLGTNFTANVGNLRPNNLMIHLGINPHLTIPGSGTSSSAIDVTTNMGLKLVSQETNMPVLPSSPQDIKYLLVVPTPQSFGPAGGILQILDSPDARFRRHRLYLPPGVTSSSYLFAIYPPNIPLPYLSAVTINAASEAYITLEYSTDSIDFTGGYLEKFVRIALMVQVSPGVWEPEWRNVLVIIDRVNHTITARLGDLYGVEGMKQDGSRLRAIASATARGVKPEYGISGDPIIADARKLVDPHTINVQEGGGRGNGWAKSTLRITANATLTPNPDCIYVNHCLVIPSYSEVPSGGYQLTIRQATETERGSFPAQSGAIFVIESNPDFPSDVLFNMTAQYVPNPDPALTDVVTLDGQAGTAGKLRLVKKNPTTGVFEFVSHYSTVTHNSNYTIATTGLLDLTDDGIGIYGLAVNPSATSFNAGAQNWAVYE